jgi:prefoldin subunit 5
MLKKEKNTIVELKEGIDELMLIVKKLGQLIDQKDERIKEMEKQLLKYEEKERHNTKQGKADA